MSSSRRRSKGDEDDVYYSRGSTSSSRQRRDRSRSRSSSSSRDSNHRHRRQSDHPERRERHDHRHRDDSHRRRRSRSRSRDNGHHRDGGSSRHNDRSTRSHQEPGDDVEKPRVPQPIPSDTAGISIKLGLTPQHLAKPSLAAPAGSVIPKVMSTPLIRSTTVASIFNDDDDEEPEEMPPEAKMKMKNVGRNTPTSAGPNSFGKTKIGFCNAIHIAERDLEEKQLGNK